MSQEALCFLLPSLLASAVFLLYSIVSFSFCEANHFLYDVCLLQLIVLIGHPIFLNIFFTFVSLIFLKFRVLLILGFL
jgi:hypothetical protein